MSDLSWLQKLECKGATILILAILNIGVLAFLGAATILRPDAVFDSGVRQMFWLSTQTGLLGGLLTALSNSKKNGGANGNGAAGG